MSSLKGIPATIDADDLLALCFLAALQIDKMMSEPQIPGDGFDLEGLNASVARGHKAVIRVLPRT